MNSLQGERTAYTEGGIALNTPEALHRARNVPEWRPRLTKCDCCGGSSVRFRTNIKTMKSGKVWLHYHCYDCHAQVPCAHGTDIPLGMMLTAGTVTARSKVRVAVKTLTAAPYNVSFPEVFRSIAATIGVERVEIAEMTREQCHRVLNVIKATTGLSIS